MGQALEQLRYKKSNKLITAKYKASGLENQLIAIALTRLEEQYDDTGLIGFEAEIYPGEIRQLIKDDDHIYRDLKNVSRKMTGRTICLEDGKGNFKTFALIPNANYEDRVFRITFNKELKPHIYELSEKYTTLQLSMVTNLKDWSFRIYEVLKKDAYLADRSPKKECIVEYRLSEFRFMIGIANIDSDKIKNSLKNDPDWDALYDMLPKKDKKYERPADFSKNVLEPAKIELAEKSDLLFDYEMIKEGRFYKRIRFTLKKQKLVETADLKKKQSIIERGYVQLEIPIDMPRYSDFLDQYEGDPDFKFGKEDLTLLLEKANYNEDLVRNAIEAAREQSFLENFMGWIISYISSGGYSSRPSSYGNVERAQKAKEAVEDYQKSKSLGGTHEAAWKSYQKREKFPEFIDFLAEHSLDEEALVDIYGYEGSCKIYFEWNRGGEVVF